jgi:hypothetical protein
VIAGRVLSIRERFPGAQTNGTAAYGKSVWSWRLKVGAKSRDGEAGPTGWLSHHPRGDGDKQILIAGESAP